MPQTVSLRRYQNPQMIYLFFSQPVWLLFCIMLLLELNYWTFSGQYGRRQCLRTRAGPMLKAYVPKSWILQVESVRRDDGRKRHCCKNTHHQHPSIRTPYNVDIMQMMKMLDQLCFIFLVVTEDTHSRDTHATLNTTPHSPHHKMWNSEARATTCRTVRGNIDSL